MLFWTFFTGHKILGSQGGRGDENFKDTWGFEEAAVAFGGNFDAKWSSRMEVGSERCVFGSICADFIAREGQLEARVLAKEVDRDKPTESRVETIKFTTDCVIQ